MLLHDVTSINLIFKTVPVSQELMSICLYREITGIFIYFIFLPVWIDHFIIDTR